MRTHPPSWLRRLSRLVIAAVVDRPRRSSVEGDLAELWQHRLAAGRRDLRRARLRDLAGLIAARSPRSVLTAARHSQAPAIARGASTVWQDVRYALRLMRRRPGTTVATVLTLAIGIGAGAAIFTAVDRLLLQPLPFPQPDRIVHVEHGPLRFGQGEMLAQSFVALPAIAAAGIWAPGGMNLDSGGDGVRLSAAVVDHGFFAAMGVPPLVGQPLPRPGGDSRFVVLAYDLWRRRFNADRAIIGQAISLNGQLYVVTGVMPPEFAFPGRTEVWVPPGADLQMTGVAFAPQIVARIAPEYTLDQARQIAAAYDQTRRAARGDTGPPGDDGLTLSPLSGELTRQARPTLLFLAASAALLLLVVCASVANLLLARVAMREQEFAVRRALGATRWRVVRQLMIECLMLSLAGAAVGGVGAGWTLDSLRVLAPDALGDMGFGAIDLRFLGLAVGVSVVTAVVFGVAPGLAAASHQAEQVVRAGREELRSPFWRRLRSGLIVSQMAIALVLLTASAAAVSALLDLTRIDPGFGSPRALAMTVTLPMARYPPQTIPDFFERAHARLTAVPGVRRIGATGFLPGSKEVGAGLELSVPDRPAPTDEARFFATYLSASPDYFTVMGIRVIEGRPFASSDRTGAPPVVVLSQGAATGLFPDGGSPIGQRVHIGRPGRQTALEIVGVVADVRLHSLDADSRGLRQAYVPLLQSPPFGSLSFVVEMDGRPTDGVASIRAAMADIDATIPVYDTHALDSVVDRYLASHRLAGTLITGFALVTLVVAGIGLYGLMGQLVTERVREIGIRVALGASPLMVRRQIVLYGAAHAAAGAVLGAAAAYGALRIFGSVVPTLGATSPWVLAANGSVLLVIAIVATWIPSSRVIRVDPVTALRQ